MKATKLEDMRCGRAGNKGWLHHHFVQWVLCQGKLPPCTYCSFFKSVTFKKIYTYCLSVLILAFKIQVNKKNALWETKVSYLRIWLFISGPKPTLHFSQQFKITCHAIPLMDGPYTWQLPIFLKQLTTYTHTYTHTRKRVLSSSSLFGPYTLPPLPGWVLFQSFLSGPIFQTSKYLITLLPAPLQLSYICLRHLP